LRIAIETGNDQPANGENASINCYRKWFNCLRDEPEREVSAR